MNSDVIVQIYKNKKPVVNEYDRAEIIRNIKTVNKCIITETLDKVEVLNNYSFEAVFIGDDWKGVAF